MEATLVSRELELHQAVLSSIRVLRDPSTGELATRETLTFLSFREKLLAGSWRFDTYFGRDTLLSLRLLMPVLSATAVESGLGSVLARLSPQGEVAHEEDIGEQAVLDHMRTDGTRSAAPVYDYKMVDEDYLLAPVAAEWLLQPGAQARSAPRAAALPCPVALGRGARAPAPAARSAARGARRSHAGGATPVVRDRGHPLHAECGALVVVV